MPYEGLYGQVTHKISETEDKDHNFPDLLMDAEVLLLFQKLEMQSAHIVGRSKDSEGTCKGNHDKNII